MEFTPDTYREAAFERLNAAKLLHDAGRYSEAHYLSGVAVECILRAYHGKTGKPFDERHDLKALAKTSGYLDIMPEPYVRQVAQVLGMVVEQWRNSHRYRTRNQLKKFLKNQGLDRQRGRQIRGEFVKECSRLLLTNASWLVHLGDQQWHR